ncbi:MAG: hypothetical protein K1X75_16080 [Leptospirales bacterium]|nr:hypothetical protein [Leptospirales bacterium]
MKVRIFLIVSLPLAVGLLLSGVVAADTPASGGYVQPRFTYQSTIPPELLLPGVSPAQVNIQRYWNYRARLRNEFVAFDNQQGSCLPATGILTLPDGRRWATWGDATAKLGWYMGALATELYMLGHPQQYPGFGGAGDVHNATRELYCALLALERLDRFGEQAMWSDHPIRVANYYGAAGYQWPDTPGFFIRDDVTAATGKKLSLSSGQSDYTAAWGPDFVLPPVARASQQRKNKEMSQDQVVHLLIGLALIKQYAPADLSYNNSNLRNWAIAKSGQLVAYLDRGHINAGEIFGEPIRQKIYWLIEEPVSPKLNALGICPFCVRWFNPYSPVDVNHMDLVERGHDARAFAGGFNLAGAWINGQSHPVSATNARLWQLAAVPTTPDNIHMAMSLAAIGHGWGAQTTALLSSLAPINDFCLYPLLHGLLHEGGALPPNVESKIVAMLSAAPYGGTSADGTPGWSSQNRFMQPKKEHDQKSPLRWTFHGLDYILLNNLYYLARPAAYTGVSPSERPASIPEIAPL